jgi:ADP-ribose pyrophosphatase
MAHTRRPVFKLGVVDVGVEHTTLPNGAEVDLPIVRHPGASAIVALDGDGSVAMLRQFRHAVGDYLWEVPAGCRDPGEDYRGCAERELAEEAGLRAARWDHLGAIFTIPSFCDERIELFLARDLAPVGLSHERDEVITVERVPLDRVLAMLDGGEIIDAKSVAALYRARDFLARR